MKSEKILESISTTSGLYDLIKKATCSIDWRGRRIINNPSFKDVFTVEEIADKFLKFPFFVDLDKENSLEEQFCMCTIWEKIEELYHQSDKHLEKTYLYWLMVPATEKTIKFSKGYFSSLDVILGHVSWGKEEYVFQFKEETYRRLWKDKAPKTVVFLSHEFNFSKRLIATKEMVKQILAKKYPSN